MTDQNIKIAFDLFDTDGSGTIDINEFYHLISNCDGEKKVEHTKGFACVEYSHENNHGDDHGDDHADYWINILKEIDIDGNGVIDFKEF